MSNVVYSAEAKGDYFIEGDMERPKHVVVKVKRSDKLAFIEETSFNPYSSIIESLLAKGNIGPAMLYENDKIVIIEYIYNKGMNREMMLEQSYRLWIMQPLADFLNNKIDTKQFGGKANINFL